jgi:DNA-binding CsgD family transcriptional regulator
MQRLQPIQYRAPIESVPGQRPNDAMPACADHPGSLVRRYRSHGPNGPGVYPQCVPADGGAAHLLAWPDHASGTDEPTGSDSHALSPSEREVLEDAALGLTVNETARKRMKGEETVKTQRRSILLKLGARNMAHAVATVMRERSFESRRAA